VYSTLKIFSAKIMCWLKWCHRKFLSECSTRNHTVEPAGMNTMLPHFSELWSHMPWKPWSKFYQGPLCFHVQSMNKVVVWVQTLHYVKLYSEK
jgi:hypothetical protein